VLCVRIDITMASHRHSRPSQAQMDDDSSPMIYDAALDEDWPRVLDLCETHPHCAKYAGPDGRTALHLACQHKCQDTAVFEALMQASPDSILKQEDKGMVPLHYACRFQAPLEIVRIMVDFSPGLGIASVSKRDRRGRTPLDYAEREDDCSDVVSMLRDMNPNGRVEQMENNEPEEGPPRPEVRLLIQHKSTTHCISSCSISINYCLHLT
jgi:ankyrin repeat protein